MAIATYLSLAQSSPEGVGPRAIPLGRHEQRLQANPSIETLIERAKSGESRAFEILARQFLRPAYVVALAIVRRPTDAEDVAQDALMLAFERLDSCREPNRFAAWLMTIVRNQARNWLDKRRLRDVLPVEPSEPALETAFGNEPNVQKRQMLRALERLSPIECEVVMLHDLEGYTHEEIGDTLGISCVMSRQHLFVSRKKLRQALGIAQGTSEAEGDEGYHG